MRRFAGGVLFPHACCFRCSICRWFRASEAMGRSTNTGKMVIGERWYGGGEWSRLIDLWKGEDVTVGAVNQDVSASRDTPSPVGEGTGPAAPAAVYPNPQLKREGAQDAALYQIVSPREGLRTSQVRPKVTPTAG
jgi:hypothetical protein